MGTHEGHRERMHKRAGETGLVGFQPHEVLEMLLMETIPRRDVNPLAHELIDHFGSFSGVLDASKEELMQISGVGERTAEHLTRQAEYYAYYLHDRWKDRQRLLSAKLACEYCSTLYARQRVESVMVICLDVQRRIIAQQVISSGTIDEAPIYPRTVAEVALRHHAYTVLLVHNHPSGSVLPSPSDVAISERVAAALLTLEIRLSDHIIVAGPKCCSMYRGGYFAGVQKMTEEAFHMLPKESFPWNRKRSGEACMDDAEEFEY